MASSHEFGHCEGVHCFPVVEGNQIPIAFAAINAVFVDRPTPETNSTGSICRAPSCTLVPPARDVFALDGPHVISGSYHVFILDVITSVVILAVSHNDVLWRWEIVCNICHDLGFK